jgi:hypothetical protein
MTLPGAGLFKQLFGAFQQDEVRAGEYRESYGGDFDQTGADHMLRKSLRISAGEPSFFYLMLAETCFQRAVSTRHPRGSSTLRKIGRSYLANASGVASVLESEATRFPAE